MRLDADMSGDMGQTGQETRRGSRHLCPAHPAAGRCVRKALRATGRRWRPWCSSAACRIAFSCDQQSVWVQRVAPAGENRTWEVWEEMPNWAQQVASAK